MKKNVNKLVACAALLGVMVITNGCMIAGHTKTTQDARGYNHQAWQVGGFGAFDGQDNGSRSFSVPAQPLLYNGTANVPYSGPMVAQRLLRVVSMAK